MSLGLALFEHFKNPNNKTIICIICIQAASFDNTGLGEIKPLSANKHVLNKSFRKKFKQSKDSFICAL